MKAFFLLSSVAFCWSMTSREAFAFGRGAAAVGGSYTTPRGGTVQAGGAGVARTGPAGVTSGRAVGGAKYTSPTGQTATKVGRVGGVQGPGGTTIAGRSGVVVGPNGGVAASRGGVAVGPYGGVAASRGGVAVGPGGGVAVRHSTFYSSPSYVAGRGVAIRGGYNYHAAYFNRGWYVAHPGAWTSTRLTSPSIWAFTTWASLAAYVRLSAQPIYYDYGSTVVYQDNSVYINGDLVATTDEFAASAATIADSGRAATPPADDEWQPLGVFGLVQGEESVANNLFQLSINKAGVIRGNYYDALGDNNLPVYGSVDKKTQRAAWSVGEKKDIVYEAGLSNLTQSEATVLIHYGKEKTRQMMLVRLEDQNDDGQPPK